MSQGTKLLSQFRRLRYESFQIVNLPVENHPDGPILIRHGLLSAIDIDDAQTSMPQSETSEAGERKRLLGPGLNLALETDRRN